MSDRGRARRVRRAIARAGALIAIAATATAAHGDGATVMVTLNAAGQQLAADFGDSEAALIQHVQDEVNQVYQTARLGALLAAFVDTTAFANRDLGVDYATRPGELMFGVVADGALASDATFSSSGHLTSGAVANLAVMAGANLARWSLPKWSVFANAFYASGSLDQLDGHLTTLGAHVQYKLVAQSQPAALRWIGVDATSGLEYARWTLGASAPIVTKFTIHGTTMGARNLTLTSTGTLSLVANTVTVPIELTTGVSLGNTVALYGGGGLDFTVGGSTLTAGLSGDLTITSDMTNVGSVVITASGSSTPSLVAVHAIAGLQFNLPYSHLFIQCVASPSVTGLSVGLRIAL